MKSIAFIVVIIIVLLLIFAAKRPKARPVSELPEPSEEVRRLIAQKQKIAAVKAYREQTGASLAEATQVVTYYTTQ